jgi:hypothetical protein
MSGGLSGGGGAERLLALGTSSISGRTTWTVMVPKPFVTCWPETRLKGLVCRMT